MGSRLNDSAFDRTEQEAHAFALALLMPREMVIAEFNKMKGLDLCNDAEIKLLADKFGVSITAMAVRLSNLKLI